ncbi:hypothetical protein SAPIO_CDS2082 [Scedosporium apiospermum]|uniref:Uncharacterized protein n=1 Tax=Pseudallescheria apiosperma TaxID=563466 RepID=A0A084GD74_PSEDA|nr:uncharacterized protein SAPIO_CDS2082 [Scedosporium apiospermum]KEZ45286.1 hypothetical protein SAPIO_CDS2082 [Scedosporium apiospermum]
MNNNFRNRNSCRGDRDVTHRRDALHYDPKACVAEEKGAYSSLGLDDENIPDPRSNIFPEYTTGLQNAHFPTDSGVTLLGWIPIPIYVRDEPRDASSAKGDCHQRHEENNPSFSPRRSSSHSWPLPNCCHAAYEPNPSGGQEDPTMPGFSSFHSSPAPHDFHPDTTGRGSASVNGTGPILLGRECAGRSRKRELLRIAQPKPSPNLTTVKEERVEELAPERRQASASPRSPFRALSETW